MQATQNGSLQDVYQRSASPILFPPLQLAASLQIAAMLLDGLQQFGDPLVAQGDGLDDRRRPAVIRDLLGKARIQQPAVMLHLAHARGRRCPAPCAAQ